MIIFRRSKFFFHINYYFILVDQRWASQVKLSLNLEVEGEGCEKNANAADGEHEDNDDGVDDAQSERLKCWELNCRGQNYREVNCQLP